MKLLAFAALLISVDALANVLWVSDANYGNASATGAPDSPYGTIQDAIRAASPGDTVMVRPGVYGRGVTNVTDVGNCRVYIDRPITLKAESSDPGDTVIMGAADPDGANGCGPNAVRCVFFGGYSGTTPSLVQGFTITGGHPWQMGEGSYDPQGSAAGVAGKNGDFFVTDCLVTNNVGFRGGAVRLGTYVRCVFSGNRALSGQSVGRDIVLAHCLAYCNDSTVGDWFMNATIINSTICNGKTTTVGRMGRVRLYNTIACENATNTVAQATFAATNCVLGAVAEEGLFEKCICGNDYSLVAPLKGDYRLRAGSRAVTAGDSRFIGELLSQAPAAAKVWLSLDGVEIEASAADRTIAAGCHQRPVATFGGYHLLRNAQTFDKGRADATALNDRIAYAFCTNETSPLEIAPVPDEGYRLFSLDAAPDRIQMTEYRQYPRMDDTFILAAPPAGLLVTNYLVFTRNRYCVATNGNNSAAGTAEAPFKTIQCAVDACSRLTPTVVDVGEGIYQEGTTHDETTGHYVRLALTNGQMVRIVGAGRGKSFVKGAADPNSPTCDGRGPHAVSCLIMRGTYACVQGFTLTGGYANTTNTVQTLGQPEPDEQLYYGGLVLAETNARQQVLDCDLINGVAFNGGLAFGGTYVRCHFSQATSLRTLVGYAKLYHCLVDRLQTGTDRMGVASSCSLYRCTVYDENASGVVAEPGADGRYTIFGRVSGGYMRVNANAVGNVYYDYEGFDANGTREGVAYLRVNPMFADPSAGDYRLATCSAARTPAADPQDFRLYAGDFNGRAPHVAADGTCPPGAFGTPVEGVYVSPSPYAALSPTGLVILERGESVKVVAKGNGTRPFLGVTVNGETLLGNPVETTITAGSALSANGHVIAPIISTNWYVNAVSGDDDNDGFTPETAWKHLTMLSKNAYITRGDRVHAAPGDYNVESVEVTAKYSFKAGYDANQTRVEVPQGVTLIADEGPEVTFITGADGTEKVDAYGNGLGAVRCATLKNSASLEGFTLRGGRTYSTGVGANDGDQFTGGGVLAAPYAQNAAAGRVYNCVITNCAACRGGALRGGLAVNCKIYDCVATACSGVADSGWLVGCHIDDMTRGNRQWCRNSHHMSHCTIGPNVAFDDNASILYDWAKTMVGSEMVNIWGGIDNTVVLSPVTRLEKQAGFYANCVFVALDESVDKSGFDSTCVELADLAAFNLDADCRPTIASAALLDKAVTPPPSNWRVAPGDTDAAGKPRVSNGAMDIGAYEFDWRPVYKASLGAGDFTVVTASPQVVGVTAEEVPAVLIRDGVLEVGLPAGTSKGMLSDSTLDVRLTGGGVLTILTNGVTYAVVDGSAPAHTVRLVGLDGGVANAVSFRYAKALDDTSAVGAVVSGHIVDTVWVSVDGQGLTYPRGAEVTLTAGGEREGDGVKVACTGWRGSGAIDATGTQKSLVFSAVCDSTLDWLYATNYWLSVISTGPGTVTGANAGWHPAGEELSVGARADAEALVNVFEFTGEMLAIDRKERAVDLVARMSSPATLTVGFKSTRVGILIKLE